MPSKPSYRARLVSYVIPIGLFLIMTAVVLLLARGYTFDPAREGLRKTGLVVLDSNPKDAYITVDGTVRRERTRATLKLPPGDYEVKVDMPGVHPWQKRIDLDPGEAELEEHILLFRREPTSVPMTTAAPVAQALSASGAELAFLTPAPDAATLSVARIKPESMEPDKTPTALPAAYAAPHSLAWAPDGSRIVVSAGNETRIVTADAGRTTVLPVGGRAAIAPGRSDSVVVEPEPGRLVRVTAGEPAVTEPYESDVTAWAAAGGVLYVARSDGSLVRWAGGNDRRVISRQPVLTDLTAAAEDTEKVFARDAGRTLYRVTDEGLEQLATDVERYTVSRDGNQVAYVKQRELRLWNGLEEEDLLLTRFTDPPEQLAVIPGGYYVLYGRADALHAIAADGSNDTVLATGVDLVGVINREQVLVRERSSGRSVALTILRR